MSRRTLDTSDAAALFALLLATAAPAGCSDDAVKGADTSSGGVGGSAGAGADAGQAGQAGGDAGSSGGLGGVAGEGGLGGAGGDTTTECAQAKDGTDCTLGSFPGICLDGQCNRSRCGDSFVDETMGEECDLGPGNGALDSNCTWNCAWVCTSLLDCGETDCRLASECERHACTQGAAKADDLACGPHHGFVCKSGECVDKACDAADDCSDDSRCTIDTCADDRCVHVDETDVDDDEFACIDDCDNENPDITSFQPWYADCDRDGYARDGAQVESVPAALDCAKPDVAPDACDEVADGWTKVAPEGDAVDCDDAQPAANPAVTDWLETKLEGQADPLLDFDYNCDLEETPRYTQVSASEQACTADAAPAVDTCSSHSGWTSATQPECGVPGSFVLCEFDAGVCGASAVTQVQACH